jgi:acetoin:2,6-dichlorophenolindophenol oxidoreductase subunit beta
MAERKITFGSAVNEALDIALGKDPSVLCFGLGVPDPKGVFGTTQGLQQKHGPERVFDMPTAENGMTGIAIGAAISGMRPIMTHQRLDFFLLAMDQLVNNAAKWHYMFGGQCNVPLTVRLIIGRGWGQGPTHSQSLQTWFAHIPGLKVVMPATPSDAKGLLLQSIFDPNPVVFLEHRWLHNSFGQVPTGDFRVNIGIANQLREGSDLTIIAISTMVAEGLRVADYLSESNGISCDLIDLRTISPMDWEKIFFSVRKTGQLLVLDTGSANNSVAGEIIARVSMECWTSLKAAPRRIAMPDIPVPTSVALTKGLYPGVVEIGQTIGQMLGIEIDIKELTRGISKHHDVPGEWFQGPF